MHWSFENDRYFGLQALQIRNVGGSFDHFGLVTIQQRTRFLVLRCCSDRSVEQTAVVCFRLHPLVNLNNSAFQGIRARLRGLRKNLRRVSPMPMRTTQAGRGNRERFPPSKALTFADASWPWAIGSIQRASVNGC